MDCCCLAGYRLNTTPRHSYLHRLQRLHVCLEPSFLGYAYSHVTSAVGFPLKSGFPFTPAHGGLHDSSMVSGPNGLKFWGCKVHRSYFLRPSQQEHMCFAASIVVGQYIVGWRRFCWKIYWRNNV